MHGLIEHNAASKLVRSIQESTALAEIKGCIIRVQIYVYTPFAEIHTTNPPPLSSNTLDKISSPKLGKHRKINVIKQSKL